jgi:hypothetical protein
LDVQRGTQGFCIGCEIFKGRLGAKTYYDGLFETSNTLGQTLSRNLQDFLREYGLTKKSVLM